MTMQSHEPFPPLEVYLKVLRTAVAMREEKGFRYHPDLFTIGVERVSKVEGRQAFFDAAMAVMREYEIATPDDGRFDA